MMNTETNETTIAHSAIMQAFAPVARLEMDPMVEE